MTTNLLTFETTCGSEEVRYIRDLKSPDIKLLWRMGKVLRKKGCRRGFDELITDMYLTSVVNHVINHVEAHRLRELIEDAGIEPRLIEPRLQKIRDKIEQLKNL